MALLILMFTLGGVAGSLITWAICTDKQNEPEPTEFGGNPL